jgi:TP901 family phage tail tape measure protein
MPINLPVHATQLEESILRQVRSAGRKIGSKGGINLGTSSKSIESLSQPLGRITGKADQFTKSMEAANARVLAFGASVGVLNAVTKSFKDLVTTTIEVEKQLTAINAILGSSSNELDRFKKTIFNVARDTEQSFATVAEAALEFSRQGLSAQKVVERLNDSMILARLSGLGAAEAVAGLTAAINSFNSTGIKSSEVLNKLSAAAAAAAVSERDLIEGIKRSGAVAIQAGVEFNELVGVISAVQEKTARGGAVIGNSFKTIFTRIQSLEKLETMQDLGVEVTDSAGQILSATKIIQNLAGVLKSFPDARRLQIAENLVGKFQVSPFISLLEDYNDETGKAIKLTEISANATTAAYERNAALNQTLSAAINQATVNVEQLFDTLGKIGVTEGLQNVLGFFNQLVEGLRGMLDEETGSNIAKGLVKGIGAVISGPGLAIFAAVIGKLTLDLVKFGSGSLKTFFGMNRAAKEQAALQGQIASSLLNNKGIQDAILKIERSSLSAEQKKAQQTKFFTTALNEQLAVMQKMQGIATRVAPGVMAGTRRVRGAFGRGAGGYIPNFAGGSGVGSEQADINRGVGGAPRSAKPVSIPNFNFGGGQRGTMVANSSEFIVPNFAGGSAIFNQNMAASMGLPAGARPVGAAGGYIPNFAQRFNIGGVENLSAAQVAAGIRKGTISKGEATRAGYVSSEAKKAASKAVGANVVKNGILSLDANNLGVLSLFSGKKEASTSLTLAGKKVSQTNPGVQALRAMGVNQVSLNNIQMRSVDNMKKGFSETRNRQKLAQFFTKPLIQYGSMLLGGAFKNDELRASRSKLAGLTRGKSSAALFSTSGEGAIFESAINLVTKGAKAIRDFTDTESERAPFDFEEGGNADSQFRRAFGFSDSLTKAEGKRTASDSAVRTLITKALNDPSERSKILAKAKTVGFKKRAASGYIPNYASSPLDNAINREVAAGLPINQVRINQKGTLRNSANPMGLAVTNTRDEPTGAIPNFAGVGERATEGANKKLVDSTKAVTKGNRDMLGTIFAVQMGLSLLSGATSDAEKGVGRFMNRLTSSLSTMTTGALAGSALTSFGESLGESQSKITRGFGKLTKGLGVLGIAVGAGVGAFNFFKNVIDDATGKTDANALAMARLADAAKNAAFSLNSLSEVEKLKISQEAEDFPKKLIEAIKKEKGISVLDLGQLDKDTIKSQFSSLKASGFRDEAIIKLFSENMKIRTEISSDLFAADENAKNTIKRFGTFNQKNLAAISDGTVDMIKKASAFFESLKDSTDSQKQLLLGKFGDEQGRGLLVGPRRSTIENPLKDIDPILLKGENIGLSQKGISNIIKRFTGGFLDSFKGDIDKGAADRQLTNKTGALTSLFGISQTAREAQATQRMGLNAARSQLSAGLLTSDQGFSISAQEANLDKAIKDSERRTALAEKIIKESKDIKLFDNKPAIQKFLQSDPSKITKEEILEFSKSISTIADRSTGTIQNDIFEFTKAAAKDDLEHREKIAKIDDDRNASTMTLAKASFKASIDAINKLATFDLQFQRATATGFEKRRLTREIDFQAEMGKLIGKPDGERLVGQAALMRAKELGDILDDASENFATSISDGLVDAIIQGKSLGDTLRSAATDFFSMISKAYMQQAVNSIVDSGGGGVGNIIGNILGSFKPKNKGGIITGGSGSRDDVPALLTGGEFVMRKSSVNKYGTGFMNSLNQGSVPKFANGGMFVPGSYGQGNISGKSNLLGFATQTGTSASADRIMGGSGFAGVALAPESLMMTNLGRSMSPAFKRTQEAKSQAFSLFLQQLQADEQRKEQLKQQAQAKKDQKRALFASLGLAAGMSLLGGSGLFGGRKTSGLESNVRPEGISASALPPGLGGTKAPRALPVLSMGNVFKKIKSFLPPLPSFFEGGRAASDALFNDQGGGDPFYHEQFEGPSLPDATYMRRMKRPMGGMIPYMAGGGGVGYSAGVDTVPAMLSGGEFVMNAAATSRIGASNLEALNSGASTGGGSNTSITKGDTNINIVVNSNGSTNQSASANAGPQDTNLAVRLKDAVKGVISDERRLGGMLSA